MSDDNATTDKVSYAGYSPEFRAYIKYTYGISDPIDDLFEALWPPPGRAR